MKPIDLVVDYYKNHPHMEDAEILHADFRSSSVLFFTYTEKFMEGSKEDYIEQSDLILHLWSRILELEKSIGSDDARALAQSVGELG